MKHTDAFRPAERPKAMPGVVRAAGQAAVPKPVGPVTYTITRGSDVFWPGRQGKAADRSK